MIKLLGEKTNKSEIEAVVREADDNGDGTVDFEGERRGHKCRNTERSSTMTLEMISCWWICQLHLTD